MLHIKMKELPKPDRPRERLRKVGVENLSNEELLAIILKTGSKDLSAKMLASILLQNIRSIKSLERISYEELLLIKGIGPAKACEILSAIELGKRIHQAVESIEMKKFRSAEMIYQYYRQKIGPLKQECFYCLYLDTQNRIMKEKLLFIGTLNYSLVHPREVFKEAYLICANMVVCIHNHPSGNVLPSHEDVNLTERLIQTGELLGIPVLDHIIVSSNRYYSFYENQMMNR